jgi:hypothetical protein
MSSIVELVRDPWPLVSPRRNADLTKPWRVYASSPAGVFYRSGQYPTLDQAIRYGKHFGTVEIDFWLSAS